MKLHGRTSSTTAIRRRRAARASRSASSPRATSATLDDEGYLFLSDRKIDMIISGGVNIYPAEIEARARRHPAVGDAAVFGIPDDELGESVKAVVELATGQRAATELLEQLMTHCRESLASYKCPRSIDFVPELPRDPNGKLYKRMLRDPYWEGRERKI